MISNYPCFVNQTCDKLSLMDKEQFEDLKQFIDMRISQAEARFDENLDEKLEELRQEMLNGFTGVGEAIEEINKQVDERLSKLERRAA